MFLTKLASFAMLAAVTWLPLPVHAATARPRPHPLPRRELAGVSVLDTPIVRAAQQFARMHSDDRLYNHVVRAWLFGTLLLDHNETLRAVVDEEVQAVGLLLHDLGANHSFDSPFVTHDRRFEVDGAFAARDFVLAHADGGPARWSDYRSQRLWDSIALHAEAKIALHKEPDVVAVFWGNKLDFSGPAHGVTEDEYAAVLKAFPKVNQREQVLEGIIWNCRHKPNTTYDTFMQPYGEMFVPGYSAVGHRVIDGILGNEPSRT